MTKPIREQDIDHFLAWLKTQMFGASLVDRLKPPAPNLLSLAFQTLQTQCSIDTNVRLDKPTYGRDYSTLPSAFGRSFMGSAESVDHIGGELSITRESLPDITGWQIVRFKCRKELIHVFESRRVQIAIGQIKINLGKVDWFGNAESEVPLTLDLSQVIVVRIAKRQYDAR
jgi:hypothetical protein